MSRRVPGCFGRFALPVSVCLLIAPALTAAQAQTPGTSQPADAPQAALPDLNESYPNIARPPWMAPPLPDPDRPDEDERYAYPLLPGFRDARTIRLGPRATLLRPGRAWHGRPYGLYTPYYPYAGGFFEHGYGASPEEAYSAGRADEREYQAYRFNVQDMNRRKQRVLSQHEKAVALGVARLQEGDYARAIVALSLAAELNQGDPACRIHLAQARLAQGHYDEAGKLLRRALQLQPRLVYADLHLARYLPDAQAFDEQVERLLAHATSNPLSSDARFLMGYLEFQRGNFAAAYRAFGAVARCLPQDALTQRYLDITKPARDLRDAGRSARRIQPVEQVRSGAGASRK
jgi:tetratricopeptide (TPR) repeat protein